jgi:hypothetical protein
MAFLIVHGIFFLFPNSSYDGRDYYGITEVNIHLMWLYLLLMKAIDMIRPVCKPVTVSGYFYVKYANLG